MAITKAVIVKVDGTTVDLLIGPDQLKMLQTAIGGWIEPVTVKYEGKLRQAFVDEEGGLKGLPHNAAASDLYCFGNICGDMVVVLEGALE